MRRVSGSISPSTGIPLAKSRSAGTPGSTCSGQITPGYWPGIVTSACSPTTPSTRPCTLVLVAAPASTVCVPDVAMLMASAISVRVTDVRSVRPYANRSGDRYGSSRQSVPSGYTLLAPPYTWQRSGTAPLNAQLAVRVVISQTTARPARSLRNWETSTYASDVPVARVTTATGRVREPEKR